MAEEKEKPKEEKKEEKKQFWLLKEFWIFFGVILVFLILVFSSYLTKLTTKFSKTLSWYAPGLSLLTYFPYVVAIGIAFAGAYILSEMGFKRGSIVLGLSIGVVLGISILAGSLSAIPEIVGGEVGEQLRGFGNTLRATLCMLGGTAYEKCQAIVTGPPTVEKQGGYQALTLSYQLEEESLRWDDKEISRIKIPLDIRNPNNIPIKDFFVGGEIVNKEIEMTIKQLTVSLCNVNRKCEIEPMGEVSISLDSKENIKTDTDSLRLDIKLSYSFSATGNSQFVLVKSTEYKEMYDLSKPTSSSGPIDVGIKFSPSKYVYDSSTNEEITMYIYLKNHEKGEATINNIDVIQDPQDPSFKLELIDCFTPDNEKFTPKGTLSSYSFKIQEMYWCNFKVPSTTPFVGKFSKDSFKTTTFTVEVDYSYEDTHSINLDNFIIRRP